MNKEEILAMEAGRELNLLVTEKVMGCIAWQEKRGEYTHIVFQKPDEREPYRKSRNWEKEMDRYKRIEFSEINNHIHVVQEIKSYSTDISAAWEVLDKLKETHDHIGIYFSQRIGKEWTGSITDLSEQTDEEGDFDVKDISADAETAQLAICRLALLTVME